MKYSFEIKDFVEQDIQPNKLAVIGDDIELTWQEFSEKVNQICELFIKQGLKGLKKPILIYGHKSANMLVAIYAMMKLEIPYVPVDKVYPSERLLKIYFCSEAVLLLNTTNSALGIEGINEVLFTSINLDFSYKLFSDDKEEKLSDPIVYMIFTSGSTGEPKGVKIGTEAIQSFARWMSSDFDFKSEDVFINSALLSFDLSVFEVITFGAIGATILLNSKEATSNPSQLMERIIRYQGTVWIATPSFMLLYSRLKNEEKLNSVHTFLFCGEVLPNDLAKKLLQNYPQANIINTYGPTEATVATTKVLISREIVEKYNSLPVGKSKMESQLLIENDEIIIVGPNVSSGYVNNAKLNEQKFKLINGQRAFKTGDKGKLVDDMLFFLGREDQLIKLHGYRIELNEINSSINNLDYVDHAECIALKRNGTVKKIVCLVKLHNSNANNQINIQNDISNVLPEYMVPADIKYINEFPLTQNGKLDKSKLSDFYFGLKG